MARVSITVNAHNYDIACADGEEQHILDLAHTMDAKVGELVNAIGQVGEARLLAMAGLLMADDTAEARDELAQAREEIAALQHAAALETETPASPSSSVDEDRLADVLEAFAARIETIAQTLEQD